MRASQRQPSPLRMLFGGSWRSSHLLRVATMVGRTVYELRDGDAPKRRRIHRARHSRSAGCRESAAVGLRVSESCNRALFIPYTVLRLPCWPCGTARCTTLKLGHQKGMPPGSTRSACAQRLRSAICYDLADQVRCAGDERRYFSGLPRLPQVRAAVQL